MQLLAPELRWQQISLPCYIHPNRQYALGRNDLFRKIKIAVFNRLFKLLSRLKTSGKTWVVQTNYMGCDMLVRANEDVGVLILLKEFESDDLRFFLEEVKESDVFVDIGANIGLYSLLAAKKIPGLKIYSFEPIPLNAALFESSALINSFTSIVIYRMCAGNSVGETSFSVASDSAFSSILNTGRKPEEKKITTRVTTIDRFMIDEKILKIDVMKIDAEGAEMLILQGAKDLFGREEAKPRLVLLELNDKNLAPFGASVGEICEIMQKYGYRGYLYEADGKRRLFSVKDYNLHENVFFFCETVKA